jgi:hypothetical protein
LGSKFFRDRVLTVAQQDLLLRRWWPDFTTTWICGRASWTGYLQPLPLSAVYRVRIEYELEQQPAVYVIDPPLMKRGADATPHLYSSGALCLFHPGRAEWRPNMPIATTIVPWASLWLLHYENWQASGIWEGGGEHPTRPRRPTRALARPTNQIRKRRE